MANEWRECTVGDIAAPVRNALVGGPFGSNLISADYVGSGIPVIRGQNMGQRWIAGDFAYVTQEKARSLEANLARPGDIVFTQRGTLGQVAMVPFDGPDLFLLSQSQMKLTPDKTKADPLFLYYLFSSAEQQDYIRQHAIQTGVPHTNLGILRRTPLTLPPLDEQEAIGRVLGYLDDKIELNRRMNATLEAMTRALFKSWFVDFDPIRAKAEGGDPGLPASIADLFPDSFDGSDLGEVPRGWHISSLGDQFEVVKGLSYKGAGLSDSGVPMHNLNSIFEGGGYKYEGIKYYTGEYRDRHVIKPGDVIVANTEQGHDRLLIGFAAIVPESIGCMSIFTHHLYRVRPRQGSPLTSRYLCYLLNMAEMHDVVSGYTNGTTVNSLSQDGLTAPLIICPPEPLIRAFDEFARHVGSRFEIAVQESTTLAELRDVLLPTLIRGKLRIQPGGHWSSGGPNGRVE